MSRQKSMRSQNKIDFPLKKSRIFPFLITRAESFWFVQDQREKKIASYELQNATKERKADVRRCYSSTSFIFKDIDKDKSDKEKSN